MSSFRQVGNRPSKFRSYLSFQSKTAQADDEGGRQEKPNTICQVWGHVGAASGSESWLANELRSVVEYSVTIAKRNDIKADMLVVDRKGRVLEVLAVVDDDDDARFIKIPCRQYRENTQAGAPEE